MYIKAGLGVGKNSRKIQEITGQTVVIAVPKVLIAYNVYGFMKGELSKLGKNVSIQVITGQGSHYSPSTQIIIVTYGTLNLWLRDGKTSIPSYVVFDESHNFNQISNVTVLSSVRYFLERDKKLKPRSLQTMWIFQSGMPDFEPLFYYLYNEPIVFPSFAPHLVTIELTTFPINVFYNSEPNSNHLFNVWLSIK